MSAHTPLRLVCPACRGPLALDGASARCTACRAAYPEEGGILHLVAGATAAPGYDPHYFSTLPLAEEKHFWFVARRRILLEALLRSVPDLPRRALLDVGCGSAGLLSFFAASGVAVAGGCDAYLEGLRIARRRVDAPLVLVDEGRLPPLGPGQSLVGLFDVLEHIDDDRGTLAWIHSILEPGGIAVLTVPAHPFLFDEMDEMAHHRRRYSRGELREKLLTAGFEIRTLTHFMATLLPLILLTRWVGRHFGLGGRSARDRWDTHFRIVPGINGLLLAALGLERLLLRTLSLPWGTSLLAVAARPATS